MALINEGLENNLLKATEADIEAKLTPEVKEYYQRITLAGMRYAKHGGAEGVMRNLKSAPDPVKACAIGGTNLAFMMLKSQNPYPSPTMLVATAHASYALMLYALDVAAKMKPAVVEITGGDGGTIEKGTRAVTDQIMANMHVTPAKFAKGAEAAHGIMKNPAEMQKIRLKIGADRDPRAPSPTLPEAEPTNEPA